jgi:hypothetical protein
VAECVSLRPGPTVAGQPWRCGAVRCAAHGGVVDGLRRCDGRVPGAVNAPCSPEGIRGGVSLRASAARSGALGIGGRKQVGYARGVGRPERRERSSGRCAAVRRRVPSDRQPFPGPAGPVIPGPADARCACSDAVEANILGPSERRRHAGSDCGASRASATFPRHCGHLRRQAAAQGIDVVAGFDGEAGKARFGEQLLRVVLGGWCTFGMPLAPRELKALLLVVWEGAGWLAQNAREFCPVLVRRAGRAAALVPGLPGVLLVGVGVPQPSWQFMIAFEAS